MIYFDIDKERVKKYYNAAGGSQTNFLRYKYIQLINNNSIVMNIIYLIQKSF